jgi:5-methylcytosine-specific restriction enzyme subunit McrC
MKNGRHSLTTKNYIGYIVTRFHKIRIDSKIDKLNLQRMFSSAYDLRPFKREDIKYLQQKNNTIFEFLVKKFLERVEDLCKIGIYKMYRDIEENLPYVKGKILFKENLLHNALLDNRVFCRYLDFDQNTIENRIIKSTLYQLLKTKMEKPDLYKKTRSLLINFEHVGICERPLDEISHVTYNMLTKHYEPIITLCNLILNNTSINLQYSGEFKFSRFIVDMEKLFESFVAGILSSRFNAKGFAIRRGTGENEKGRAEHADIQKKTNIFPDIIIQTGHKIQLLLLDAKYKKKLIREDLYQIWIYLIALKLPLGVLVYPFPIEVNGDYHRTLREVSKTIVIKTISLDKQTDGEFINECNRFVDEIEVLLRQSQSRS